tara:strand:+ start:3024 stop:3995 length:972 start_codon:yes stop_codon:yes gene_type:complete
MPIPKPNENETEQDFLDRCMSDDTMQEYENDERLAICKTQIENKNTNAMATKRHIKEVIEDNETITIVYEKDENFEGLKLKDEDMPDEGDEETIGEDEETDGEEEEEYNSFHPTEIKSVWDNNITTEKRFYNVATRITKRNGKQVIEGHAAIYDSPSEDLGGFTERIKKGAFDNVLDNDVRAYFNHDPNFILGRTTSGTLRISADDTGLKYEFDVPDTTAGRDLVVSMKRGDITQSSFAFTVEEDSWEQIEGKDIRTINKVKRLYDVSPVSIPAYPSANDLALAQRSKMIYIDKQKMQEETDDEINRSIEKLKLKINILKRKK